MSAPRPADRTVAGASVPTAPAPTWRRHPATLALRRAARLAHATLQRTWTRNPPLPPAVRSLLFVCKGNICRSPFAAVCTAAIARDAGLTGTISRSAGLEPSQANACPAEAVAAASRHGYDLSTWRPVRLTDELMAAHDLIIVMEASQLDAVRTRWPAHRGKTVLLSLFGPPPEDAWARLNIADPFGKDAAAFDACYARLDAALHDLVARLPR